MKKYLSILFALVLVVSLMLVPAASVRADAGSIVGLWHFDEGTGTTASDSSGNSNDGTLVGDAYFDTGYFGNAVSLDGTEDYVSVLDSSSLDITTELTIEAWVHTDVSITGSTQMQIVDKGEHKYQSAYMLMIYNGELYGRVNKNNATAGIYAYPNDGAWHYVAYTFKSGEQKLYIDGSVVATNTGSATITTNAQPLLIGRGVDRQQYCWNGEIDEVRIWDVALTASQIALSYSGSVTWLPPVTNVDFVLKDGTTLPLKFQLFDDGGLVETEQSVSLEVTAEGFTKTYTLGDGVENLRWNADGAYYIANLKTKELGLTAGSYTATVHYGTVAIGSIDFELSPEKGAGRGNSGK